MKRSLTLFICLILMLLVFAIAEDSPEPIRLAEIEQFSQALLEAAIEEDLPPFEDQGVFLARGANYEISLASGDVSADSLVLGAALTGLADAHEQDGVVGEGQPAHQAPALMGPRGSLPGMTLEEVLALFPNDNPFLSGAMDSAVLYIAGELPAAVSAGFVIRDGQNVQLVEHDVYYQAGEGVMRAGIQYTIDQGKVSAIRSFSGMAALSQQEAGDELAALRALQEEHQYVAFGEREGTRFSREDMVLGGLDFIDTTPENAAALLGEPANQETLDNGNGSRIQNLQWPGMELVFIVKGETAQLQRMLVNGGSFEGPRGLRLKDTLAQAISRFEHTGELHQGGGELYGDALNQNPPYGLMVVNEDSTLLYYAVSVQENKVGLLLEFVDDVLVSMSITYL